MNQITLNALFTMYEYWSHGKTNNINTINLLNKPITNITLYQKHIESIESYIMEGITEKTASNPTELRMVKATKKSKSKRTTQDWQELVYLFVTCTNIFVKQSINTKICPIELDRYSTLVRISPNNRTAKETNELGTIAKKIYEADRN